MARAALTPRRAAGLALAALVLDLVLIQPNHPGAMTWGALLLMPLELPAILLGLAALGDRGAGPRVLRSALAVLMLTVLVLKLGDLGTFMAFGRSFDPLTDFHLVGAGVRLLAGSVGRIVVLAILVLAVVALAGLFILLMRAMRTWSRAGMAPGGRAAAGFVALIFVGLSVAEVGLLGGLWQGPNPPGSAFSARVATEHVQGALRSRAAFEAFAEAARDDPYAGRTNLLDLLGDHDLLVVFVESYGRASLDNPLYAPTHRATLEAAQATLAEAGLAMRSGYVGSPVEGGQSWLAHATLASGLRIGDQRRYAALVAGPRATLWDLAAAAGRRTAVVAPAIVMPWPEGEALGFQTRLAADDLGYRGLPFNWVTMPDQYTLAAFSDRLGPGAPLVAEIDLLSSHAPWTPVPTLVPWHEVGDGTVFDAQAMSGDPPAVVWADEDRIRDQYRLAIDYSLRTVVAWAALPREKPPLLIILGDHPAAGFVSGIDSPDVPVHIIGPPDLVARFESWNWAEGMISDAKLGAWPMEEVRDRLIEALTSAESTAS